MRARIKYVAWNHEDVQLLFTKIFGQCEEIEIEKWTSDWLVYYLGSEPVGFAGLSYTTKTIACLELVGVLKSAGGRGIQKKLIKARERYARTKGCVKMITYTAGWNMKSINSLISCGYKTYRPMYAWAGKEFIYWWRKL